MDFYILCIIFAATSLGFYTYVRDGIYYLLKFQKRSDTFIKKHKKGIKNYWLFEEINTLIPLGHWYTFNKLYIICSVTFFFTAILLGNIEVLRTPIIVISGAMCILMTIAIIFNAVYTGLALYGCFPVPSQKKHAKHHGANGFFYSSIKDISLTVWVWFFWVLMIICT